MNKTLIEVVSKQFRVPADSLNESTCVVKDLNADSIDFVECIMNIEKAFRIAIEEQSWDGKTTLGALDNIVSSKLSQKQ